MRIDAMNQVSQIYQNNKTRKSAKTAQPSFADKLELSDLGKALQTAKTAVAGTTDVRADRVAELKAKIQNGTYFVSDEELADKLAEHFDI